VDQHPDQDTNPPEYNTKQARKAGITAFVGTTIEWFDFYIYGTASALVLGPLFFPDASPAVGTLAAFATFAVGFVARPVGGVVFGHFGDKFGRKNAVIITLALMGLGTVGVGLLPTYSQIGIWAPILLVALRVLQGIAMGGEWGGAVLIATEFAPPKKKVLYGAFAQQGSPVGNLLATLAFLGLTLMSDSVFESWGWRLPFLGSAALVIVALYIRLHISETPEMKKAVAAQERTGSPGARTAFRRCAGHADRSVESGPLDAASGDRAPTTDVRAGSDGLRALGDSGYGPRDRASRNVLRRVGRHPGAGFPHQCSVYRHLSVVPIVDRRICRNGPDGQPVSADANQLDLAGRRSWARVCRSLPCLYDGTVAQECAARARAGVDELLEHDRCFHPERR
jgi:hypothetical protein